MAAPASPKAARAVLFVLVAITVLAFLLHVGYGSTSMLSPLAVLQEIFKGATGDSNANNVVWHLRLTRGLGCLLVGGILGGVGSAFQALFRNPLADPYIVGVSSGAATGAVLAMLFGVGQILGGLGQDLAAFAGGMSTLGLVFLLAGRRGATSVVTLLLSGVVVGSMLSGVLSLAILAAGRDSNELLRWLLGDTVTHTNWTSIAMLTIALVIGGVLLILQAKSLNAFAMGEDAARRLGVDTRRLRLIVLFTGTAMAAVAVGTVGVIGFLGLAAPHLARNLVGVDWRRSLGASIVIGMALMLIADALTQRVIPAVTKQMGFQSVIDLPVGVVTALIGAPSLLILLRRAR